MSNKNIELPFFKIRIKRSTYKHWRKHGAKYLLLMLIGSIWSIKILGVVSLLALTIPCGIKQINTDKKLWYLRQLYFAGIGLYLLFS